MIDAGKPQVRLIHETNPEKYFPALYELDRDRQISLVGAHRYSVLKEWLRSWLRERKPIRARTIAALDDLKLRLRLPRIHGEVVVLGFAPWDWRMLLYSVLVRRNWLIYHTSWPNWQPGSARRQYGILTPVFRRLWLRVLRQPNVRVVAVLEKTKQSLREAYGVDAEVIPHAVPEVFFEARRSQVVEPGQPLRLIHVGELSEKKGIPQLLAIMEAIGDERLTLTIVGDGPLREQCTTAAASSPAIEFIGPVSDRAKLARLMASHDLLVLLSQRDSTWEELFGIVIAEGMAAGLGVIASNHIGPRFLLGDAALGNLFEDNDIDGPLELIKALAGDHDELRAMKESHHGLADRFRLPVVAQRWSSVIDELTVHHQVDKA
ncbi:glycosyltransferase [Mycolicibacterium neoaurum]|uniref:glycosyltransferase n=1 Tax=Mycolicibacterium neoaurum TaxID=1795 RepID=UPI00248CF6E0|nr:glycosyltransferase [Mycolicibacterium neoaurum]WBP96210.1 glycosyltransferase [Mycolicibacterium neoaurum]WBS10259.1 glycosyltransferase [Mycolicibacterium neoaurum]